MMKSRAVAWGAVAAKFTLAACLTVASLNGRLSRAFLHMAGIDVVMALIVLLALSADSKSRAGKDKKSE
jgi:hypothetical protein